VEIGRWISFAHFDFGYLSEIITLTGFGLQTFARFGDPDLTFYCQKLICLFMPNAIVFVNIDKYRWFSSSSVPQLAV